MDRTARSQGLPLSLGLRRVATVALALATSAGVGTAVATTSHAAAHTPVAPVHAPIEPTASTIKSAYDFSTYIANVGGQDQIDACTGGLTKMVDVSKYMGRDYYPIHNECGGSPILNLVDGNTVHIDGLGDYTVVATLEVTRGDDATMVKNLPGDILIQTCESTGNGMRVVALQSNSAN